MKKIEKMRNFLRKLLPKPLFRLAMHLYRLPQSIVYFRGPHTYKQDGLITRHNTDFLHDPRFQAAYNIGAKVGKWQEKGFRLQWRVHVLCWAAQHALHLEGDFVECGVNTGGFSRAVADYVNFQNENRIFYLMDTFNGLVEQYLSDTEKARGINRDYIQYAETYDYTKNIFSDFENVKLIRGPIPDTLEQVNVEKVAFLSIDMNNTVPEIAAAEYFWEKLVKSAIIVLDDYGWQMHIEQKQAFDKFATERGTQVLTLPTGQGIIIKP
jgi:O-methyltransferase